MFGEILEDLREGLAVTAEYDSKLLRGIRRSARSLLRTYNFRESVRRAVLPIAAGAQTFDLPEDAGKVKAVRLTYVEGDSTLYKVLRRREEGQLPVIDGPSFYYNEGQVVYLDQKMPLDAVGYDIEVWYQSVDPDVNEPWLSTTYEDVLEHRAGQEMALKLRKPEAHAIYAQLWEQDVAVLGRYLPELEFADLDISMGDRRVVNMERYPSL